MKVKYKGSEIVNEIKNPDQLIEMKNGEVWKLSNLEFLNIVKEVANGKTNIPLSVFEQLKKVRIFEMFSGNRTPMFSIAKIGLEPISVGFSDIKRAAIEISRINFPEDKNFGDCTKINPEEIEDFDLLTAGFPCQDVSVCGKNDLGCGRTVLFDEIIRIAEVKKPKFMLLENVKGILQKKHSSFFEHVLKELEKIGYLVKYKVLNSKDHGIPQNRPRIWFSCFRKDLEEKFKGFEFPEEEELKINALNLIDFDLERESPKNKRLQQIMNSPTGRDNPCYELKGDTPSGLSRQADRIYRTIAPCLNTVQKEIMFEVENKAGYQEIIVLSGREHMRLMGFLNDEIKLDGLSENAIKDLAGDGWDMNLASKILEKMLK